MGSGDTLSDGEKERLAFEKAKWDETVALEREKIALAKRTAWQSPFSIIVPLLVVALTIWANTRAQRDTAQAAFELKVAEVVLDAKSVIESTNRADGLVALFPDRLPADFSKRLEPLKTKLHRPDMDERGLLDMLVTSPTERRKEILDLWLSFYPRDRDLLPRSLQPESK